MVSQDLENLIKNFRENFDSYKDSSFNEQETRDVFINPFLELLGWDVRNNKRVDPNLREIVPEKYDEKGKRPDYTVTVRGVKKFFIEVKKPYVDITNDEEPALQTRSYGVTARHQIAILTNFENLYIYDTTVTPKEEDSPQVALLKRYHFSQYIDKWDEIKSIISKEAVYSSNFDEKIGNLVVNRDVVTVDSLFLKQINQWRVSLANNLYSVHPEYQIAYINDVVQSFINQIIFLRICEDRNLPTYHTLQDTIEDEIQLKDELLKVLKEADLKYNSGIFENNDIILDLHHDVISNILQSLYFPQSPFIYNIIDANILGEMYELFLSEHLVLTDDGKIELSRNSDNANRDVVSTPLEIVRYMVKKSLDPLINNKTPEEIKRLKIADIACGSGIFLIEAFSYLKEKVRQWYLNNKIDYLIEGEDNYFYLPFNEKKEILESCIYGLDIDANAVEVCKFSLLLKLLEDETEPTLGRRNALLPNLDANIKVGNALVEFEHLKNRKIDDKDKHIISAFNWNFRNSIDEFDAIIGNPPYVKTSDMNTLLPSDEVWVYEKKYKSSYKQFDKYMLFIERAIDKLKDEGVLCFIVPNKFSKIVAGEKLREILSSNSYVKEFIDFGSAQLFEYKNVRIYSSILLVSKSINSQFVFEEVSDLREWWLNQDDSEKLNRVNLNSNILSGNSWVLVANEDKANLINKLYENATLLGGQIDGENVAEIFNGIQTSAERPVPIYWFSEEQILNHDERYYTITKGGKEYLIEKEIVKPFYKPTKKFEKNVGTYDYVVPNKWIIFPYDIDGKIYSNIEMQERFPKAWGYLNCFYDRLLPKQLSGNPKGRDVPHATSDTWYHYGRIQALTRFINTPKLIVGILTKKPLYLYDNNDMLIASGGTAGFCAITKNQNSPYELEFIQAVLNHPAIEWLTSVIGSDFEGEFHSRGTAVLARLPIINVDFSNDTQQGLYNTIIANTKEIYKINKELSNNLSRRDRNSLINQKEDLVLRITDAVTSLYGIDEWMRIL
ncbi:Eco57I restriction-modification methylase domain-containing protein [Bacillus pacificus]|uniref:Eco57I restriction-modification methylase domain-containing protein n=1 Tax=Bacillus pacificus TaxID=2026187 RepID=UPI002E249D90|nr:N-6 DNA methylase [Bacillus pacificus]